VVPDGLELPELDAGAYFSERELTRAREYEGVLRLLGVSALLTELLVLAAFALAARPLARGLAVGRVGTGVLLAVLGTALLTAAQLPFSLADTWWQRRHDVSRDSYGDVVVEAVATLHVAILLTSLLVMLLMLLAGRFPRRWWLGAAPLLAGLGLAFGLLFAALVNVDTEPLRDRELAAAISRYVKIQGAEQPTVRVEEVSESTDAANAYALGIGPFERLVFWDTLLDGRFPAPEVRFVAAHEVAHLAREHVHKGFGWFILFTVPLWYVVARVTRRSGGFVRPEGVPLALLVVTVLQLAVSPAENLISRRYEAESDWIALQTTKDPAAARGLFRRFSTTSLGDPESPAWAHALFDTHPPLLDRIAMAEAWRAREAPTSGRPSREGS